MSRSVSISPTVSICPLHPNLCLWEKYFIICKPKMATLNKRNELVSACRHNKKFLLSNI